MKKIEENIIVRKLVADENKIIISKELNRYGNPEIVSKTIYLAKEAKEEDFVEINEEELILNEEDITE